VIGAYFAEAAGVLLGNRTRTALALLGLVIGVAAVIAIQILGAGTAGAVDGILGGLDDRSFFVFPSVRQANFSAAAFSYSDVVRTERAVGNILVAFPAGNVSRTVEAGHHRARLLISDDADVTIAAVPLVYGRNISSDDVARASAVCVLGALAYRRLFPQGGDPDGESLRIGERRFQIIGVKGPPTKGIFPVSFEGDVSIPYTTYVREYLRSEPVTVARFIVVDSSRIAQTERAVIAYLKTSKAASAEYQTFDRKSFSKTINGIFALLTLVVALIGTISLVVAGIGIMNVMLVSVTERTREIGVRKAIGATSAAVLAQFFIEALLLSLCGCGLGLVLGLATGWLVDRYGLIAISGVVPSVPWLSSVAIAVGFATIVTLGFGTYPAYRAARLVPIEALRYE
jgi:putative ABC transport system permease protein